MLRRLGAAAALAVGLAFGAVNPAWAEREPSTKTVMPPSPGARVDITVPYLTTGRTTLGVYNGVAPRIYASPIVDDPKNPQAKPVFNLIFYGSAQSFGDKSDGATPRPLNMLRPPRP
jgi:hypothetical protein